MVDSKRRGLGLFWMCNVEIATPKRKAGASSRTPCAVIYKTNYTTN